MSLRAVILGALGVVAVCAVVSATELVYVKAGFLQLPPAALGGLMLLLLARRALERSGWLRLAAHELAAIYGMLLVAALVSSRGLVEKMLPLLVAPNYFASATNKWQELFFPHTKAWLVAFDPTGPPVQTVARAYYERLPEGAPVPWGDWLMPILAWSLLAALVFFAFLCLASLLRRPWMEHERLPFPLAQLPLEMVRADDGKGALRSPLSALGKDQQRAESREQRAPLFWLGFALPGVVYTMGGLHTYYPAVPYLEQPFVLNQFLTDRPWNTVSWMPIYLSFAAIGLLYLAPGPLLFSLWFFFLLTRFQELVGAAYGFQWTAMPFFPCARFVGFQTMGAYFALAASLLYTAWPHLRASLRRASGLRIADCGLRIEQPALTNPQSAIRNPQSSQELLPDRVALLGLLFCLLGLSAWCALAGLSFWWSLAQWAVYLFVVVLVLARSTAEGGLLATEVTFRPADLYVMTSSIRNLGLANMTAMGFMDAAWFRDQRSLVLAGLLDAMRLGHGTGLRRRAMLGSLVGALVLATVCGIAFQLWLPYRRGALEFYGYLFQGNPIWGFQYYTGQWNSPPLFAWDGLLFFGIGVVVTAALVTLRALLPWWPLHPLGYALCGSWTMILLWFPALFVWLFKGLLLRYGGMPAFARLRPVFLGMILGEFTMAILWTALGALTDAPAPVFPWP